MKEITINTENFNYIEFMNAYTLHGGSCYVTAAEDRKDNKGIVLFIPTNNINELIESIGD